MSMYNQCRFNALRLDLSTRPDILEWFNQCFEYVNSVSYDDSKIIPPVELTSSIRVHKLFRNDYVNAPELTLDTSNPYSVYLDYELGNKNKDNDIEQLLLLFSNYYLSGDVIMYYDGIYQTVYLSQLKNNLTLAKYQSMEWTERYLEFRKYTKCDDYEAKFDEIQGTPMSLFVCENCGCVENTNSISWSSMLSNSDTICCSECFTGQWHNEFEKRYATEDEMILAKLSKYSMITPYDHPEGTIFKNDAAPHGYSSYPSVEKGITITGAAGDYDGNTDGRFSPSTAFSAGRRGKNTALIMMAGLAACGIDISAVMTGGLGQKVNSKDEQPESEKERMLKLAELKRKIKVLKKHKDLSIVQEELQNLQMMYNALKGGYHPC